MPAIGSSARRISPSSDAQSIVEIRHSVLPLDATTGEGLANATGEGTSQQAELAQLAWVPGILADVMVGRYGNRMRELETL